MRVSAVEDTYIGSLGMGDKVKRLLQKHSGSARSVVTVLAKDPEFKAARGASGEARRLTATDIHEYLTAEAWAAKEGELKGFAALQAAAEPGKPAPVDTAAVAAARESFLKSTALCEDFWRVANKFLRITEDDLHEYVELKDEGPKVNHETGEPIIPRPPVEQMEATRKAVLASLEIVKAMRNDQVIKNILNQNVMIQQGMSQEEFLNTMFAVGKRLGVAQHKILEAYGMVVAEKNGQNVIEAIPLPPEPEFRRRQAEESAARAKAAEDAEAEARIGTVFPVVPTKDYSKNAEEVQG